LLLRTSCKPAKHSTSEDDSRNSPDLLNTMHISTTDKPYLCPICSLSFQRRKGRQRHQKKLHPKCGHCQKRHLGKEELQSHQRETNHCYCSECNQYFSTTHDHSLHVRAKPHDASYQCCDCGREYPGHHALDNHCCECDKICKSKRTLRYHFRKYKAHLHVSALRGDTAELAPSKASRGNGQATQGNDPTPARPRQCHLCKEQFESKKALKQHKTSNHKPEKNIPCLASKLCKRRFAQPSALLSHLESGSCCSEMSRGRLNDLVAAHDQDCHITSLSPPHPAPSTNHDFTNQSRASPTQSTISSTFDQSVLLTLDDDTASEWSLINGVSLSPSSSEWSFLGEIPLPVSPPIYDLCSTSVTLPGGLQCDLCPPTRPKFLTEAAFQAHVASAAHAPKLFHCPLAFMVDNTGNRKKTKYFSTLSGLAQHLESGACQGSRETFIRAIRHVEERLKLLGLSEVILLKE
jgi:hypothetical protein